MESPGLLPFGLTVEDLQRGVSKLRNRVIGRVFHELGLIEQWGSGVQPRAERLWGNAAAEWLYVPLGSAPASCPARLCGRRAVPRSSDESMFYVFSMVWAVTGPRVLARGRRWLEHVLQPRARPGGGGR
ncbi:MAG: ATP-binding protein [Mycobacteriales bacterium]